MDAQARALSLRDDSRLQRGWGQQNVVLKGAYLLATLRCWLLSSLQRLEMPRLADGFRRVERSLDTDVGVLPVYARIAIWLFEKCAIARSVHV